MRNFKAISRMKWVLWVLGALSIALGVYLTFATIEFFVLVVAGMGLIGIGEALSLLSGIAERIENVIDINGWRKEIEDDQPSVSEESEKQQLKKKMQEKTLKEIMKEHPDADLTPEQLGKLLDAEKKVHREDEALN